jgi:hypothetical protein
LLPVGWVCLNATLQQQKAEQSNHLTITVHAIARIHWKSSMQTLAMSTCLFPSVGNNAQSSRLQFSLHQVSFQRGGLKMMVNMTSLEKVQTWQAGYKPLQEPLKA